MAEQKDKVIVIVGPTGVGKTALSVELARRLQGEVISGDSIQVYRGLDIGSAKVTKEEMQGVTHHLIDELDHHEEYNVKVFQERCRECLQEILDKGRMPILCGGTGLYIKAALYDYTFAQEEPDAGERKDPSEQPETDHPRIEHRPSRRSQKRHRTAAVSSAAV